MRIIKPKALKKGGVIGICAPAGPLPTSHALDPAIRYLEQLGYRVELSPNLFRRHGYLAGSDAERAADLHRFFLNDHISVILAARGGYGSHRLLPLLDYHLIRKHPKLLVGYSDITALQIALFTKAGLTSVSGRMAIEMPERFDGASEDMFWQALTSTKPLKPMKGKRDSTNKRMLSATGRVLGGNLSLLSALAGTPYFPPTWKGHILLLEEIDERPYRIDRTLQQLRFSGGIGEAEGFVLGSFTDCAPEKNTPSLSLHQVFHDVFGTGGPPLLSGFRYGHVSRSLTIPLGVRATISPSKGVLTFLESAVGKT